MFGRKTGNQPAKRFFGLFGAPEPEEQPQEKPSAEPTKLEEDLKKQASSKEAKDLSDQKLAQTQEELEPSSGKENTPSKESEETDKGTSKKDSEGQADSVEPASEEGKSAELNSEETSSDEEGSIKSNEVNDDDVEQPQATEKTNESENKNSTPPNQDDAVAEPEKSEEQIERENFQKWLDSLSTGTEQDTLLRFAPSELNSIDLTHVHPSGLTQFMVGRKTRLSTLLRDPEDFAKAKRAARLIRAKINELEEERGISVGYLACGLVTWRTIQPEPDGRMRSILISAPALLARVSIHIRPEQDDYELHIQERAFVNPALVRRFKQRENRELNTEKIVAAAYATAKLDPLPAMDELRDQISDMSSLLVENKLLISTFADLSEAYDGHELDVEHPFIAALYRGGEAIDQLQKSQPEVQLAPLDEREPESEYLVLDADPSQQKVLDYVAAGRHVLVDTAPGTGAIETATNAATMLAVQGKSVLIVAERRSGLDQVLEQFKSVQLDSVVLDLQEATDDAKLRHRLVEAILRNERATEPQLGSIHRTLKRTRHQLIDHVKSLHTVRERWSCSPLQAMQALAELTSLESSPGTNVRLKRSVLDKTVARDEISNKLVRAAQLGAFDQDVRAKKWFDARLRNRKDAESALEHAREVQERLPDLQLRITEMTEHAQIRSGENFESWADQLELLAEVRLILDQFQPDIFERNVKDLIIATATNQWRKERGIEIPSVNRSRLRKVAKAYIRPGVVVDDLHTSLIKVENMRERWNEYALSKRNPAVPLGIGTVQSLYDDVAKHLLALEMVVKIDNPEKTLVKLPYQSLKDTIDELAQDEKTLFEVPELTLIKEQLGEIGLEELLADLAERNVGVDGVADELELSWWKSALEAMISGDDYLAMVGGDHLRRIEAEFQLSDQAHIQSGAIKVAYELSQNWRRELKNYESAAEKLRTGLKEHDLGLQEYHQIPKPLQNTLTPVIVASPLGLAAFLDNNQKFDATIFLDAGEMTVSAALGGMSRGEQIIIFGDKHSADPKPFTVSVDPTAATRVIEESQSFFDVVADFLPTMSLKYQYRDVDAALMRALDSQVYQNGVHRLPSAGNLTGDSDNLQVHRVVESSTVLQVSATTNIKTSHREVNAVVKWVFEHVRLRPQKSLAVIAGTEEHARAIAEGIKRQLAEERSTPDFFKGGKEPFVVTPLERAGGLLRDHVIFSLGLAASGTEFNPHKDFIATDKARDLLGAALLSGREKLDIFTSLTPDMVAHLDLGGGLETFFGILSAPQLVGSTQKPGGSPLLNDLYERLKQKELNVSQNYGDLLPAAIQYKPNPLTHEGDLEISSTPVAIVTDGDSSFVNMSVRERSRMRPLHLKGLGWVPFTIWTIEVFSDPAHLADRIYSLSTDGKTSQNNDNVAQAEDKGLRGSGRRAKFQFTDGILPKTAKEDQTEGWGDITESRDQWLQEQRPPHWE